MAGYIGQKPAVNGTYTVDEFTSSGGTTYTLSRAPGSKNNIQVNAGGLAQYPSAYSVSGTTLTLTGVPSGQKVVVRHMGETILYPTLDADVVDGTKIADNAVDSEHYTDGSVDNVHTNFQPGTTFKGDGSSARGKIVLNCEQNTHGVSIQSPAHSSAASYTLTLPPNDGAANQVLTTDGSGVLSFAAAGGGTNGWELLATNIVTSAAASSDFTSVNTTDYKMHMIHYYDWHTGSGNIYPNIRLIDASGPISASNYYGFIVRGKYNSATVNGVQMNAVPYINLTGAYNWSAAANPITGYCIFSDVGQAGVRQGWWGQSAHHLGGTGDLSWSWYGGMSAANTAVTGYMLRQDSGNFNKGKFQLYGLKGS